MGKNNLPPKRPGEPVAYFARPQGGRPQYNAGSVAVKPRKKHGIKKVFISLLCVVLAVCLGLGFFVYLKLDEINYVTPQQISEQMGVSFDTDLQTYQQLSGGSISIADGDIFKQSGVENILILGTDERTEEYSAARSDSMMILSINKKKNTWALVSLERAMGVLIPGRNPDWLTHTFSYGGPELVLATVRNHLKIDIDRYVRINFSAFQTAIDALGGVEISLTDVEAIYLNTLCGGSFGIGPQQLNGEFALQYARMRRPDSDWKRVQRQRNVISAIVTKTKTLNLIQLNSFADKVLPLVQTNLTKGEMFSLILHAPFLMHKEMKQLTLPAEGTFTAIETADGKSMYIADFNANAEILRELFYE